jgi:hypothetical protein
MGVGDFVMAVGDALSKDFLAFYHVRLAFPRTRITRTATRGFSILLFGRSGAQFPTFFEISAAETFA